MYNVYFQTPALTKDTGTQYDISDILSFTSHQSIVQDEHDYSFPLQPSKQSSEIAPLRLHCTSLAERLVKQSADFYSMKVKLAELSEEVENYKKREFTLEHIKQQGDKAQPKGYQGQNPINSIEM